MSGTLRFDLFVCNLKPGPPPLFTTQPGATGLPRWRCRPPSTAPAYIARQRRPQIARGRPGPPPRPPPRPPRRGLHPPRPASTRASIGPRILCFLLQPAPAGPQTLAPARISCDPGRRPWGRAAARPGPPGPRPLVSTGSGVSCMHDVVVRASIGRQFFPRRFFLSQPPGPSFRPAPGFPPPPRAVPVYISGPTPTHPHPPHMDLRTAARQSPLAPQNCIFAADNTGIFFFPVSVFRTVSRYQYTPPTASQ